MDLLIIEESDLPRYRRSGRTVSAVKLAEQVRAYVLARVPQIPDLNPRDQ